MGGSQSLGTLGRLIRWATRQKGEPGSLVNHSFLVVNNSDRLEDVEIVEAVSRVRIGRLVEFYGGTGKRVELWRATNLSDADRDRVRSAALARVGRRYPYHRLLFQLIDEKLFKGRLVVRRLGFLGRWRICTPLVAECFFLAGYSFGLKSPAEANPDNVRDFMASRPDKYQLVRELSEV